MLSHLKRWLPRRLRRSTRLLRWLPAATGRKVVSGPFAGLSYVADSRGSVYWPKLLGTYELEVGSVVEAATAKDYRHVLVAGAAEGYYAVGLAVRLPSAQVVAWEPDPGARGLLAELAAMNGVTARLSIEGICDSPALGAALGTGEHVLLVMDVDGGEAVLLDPRITPALRQVDVLVETHDCFVPGVTEAIVQRFAPSHEVTRINPIPRDVSQVVGLAVPTAWHGALLQLLSEGRPPGNSWLWLVARSTR